MIMMLKIDDDCYQLLMQHPEKITQFGIISKMNKRDYDFMLTNFKRIRNSVIGPKEYDNASYFFPRDNGSYFTVTRVSQRGIDDYVIDANFNSVILSEMIGVELDLMIFELECLLNYQRGTPAYFPPPKDKPNVE